MFLDSDSLDSLERLRRDLRVTGRSAQLAFVDDAAANVASFATDASRFVHKVVEDVQQRLQDEFIDTTWPACPVHRRHPLNYDDGAWRCPTDGAAIAELGGLGGDSGATAF